MLDVQALRAMSRKGKGFEFESAEAYRDWLDLKMLNMHNRTLRQLIEAGADAIMDRTLYQEFVSKQAAHLATYDLPDGTTMLILQEWDKRRRMMYRISFLMV